MTGATEHYILATGGTDIERLRLLHEVYGPGTEAAFHRVGLRPGQRVVEVGCGSGNIARWVALQVGPTGSVLGIDNSPEQVDEARRLAKEHGVFNVEFQVADAYSPRLPEASFDLAYCRLVLMHLKDPALALAAMRSLVKPGGKILCEEMDLGVWLCDPPTAAVEDFFRLNIQLGEAIGEHFGLGASLHKLFRRGGLKPEVASNFVLALHGEQKRLLAMTFVEFGPELIRRKLATPEIVARVNSGLEQMAADDTTMLGFPLVVQVWASV